MGLLRKPLASRLELTQPFLRVYSRLTGMCFVKCPSAAARSVAEVWLCDSPPPVSMLSILGPATVINNLDRFRFDLRRRLRPAGRGDCRSQSHCDRRFDRRGARNRHQRRRAVPHRFVMSGVYIVPETFAGNRVMNRLLGGWELSAVTTLASGTPYSTLNANRTDAACLEMELAVRCLNARPLSPTT